MSKLIYLASPFSHKSKWVMKLRWAIITSLAAKLIGEGVHLFGPITESHSYVEFGLQENGWEFWKAHDCLMLEKCDEVWVAKMKGWEESIGVTEEIKYAIQKGKPIKYLDLKEHLPEIDEVI